jgi:hypothetical protein
MANDVDKARIDALLRELRALDHGDPPPSVDDLARRHRLDPMIVRRIAESEDVDLRDEPGTPGPVDDDADTGPL